MSGAIRRMRLRGTVDIPLILQRIRRRLVKSVTTIPDQKAWFWAITLLLLYGLIYLPVGFMGQFLTLQFETLGWTIAAVIVRAFVIPGITEELLFRALLIPHSTEAVSRNHCWLWSSVSLTCFVLYHPFNFSAPAFFSGPVFLVGAGLLGIVCTLSYLQSGSI